MELLIDTNILLDVLQERRPYVDASSAVWKLCETGLVKGYVSVLSFADLVYVMRKVLTPQKTDDVLRKLKMIFEFVGLEAFDMSKASSLCWDDFEDAIQNVTAERMHVDYIVTRNGRDFVKSKIPALTPEELIERL